MIKRKAIIVEDNLILSILYEDYLNEKVFKTAGKIRNGDAAIRLVQKYEPDLVIMDIKLEGEMDGVEAAIKIRTFSDVPIIFITGNSDPLHKERAALVPNSEFLRKPISKEILFMAMDDMLNDAEPDSPS
ncbi:response regulator [Balneola sp. MJW-20]|uniref:response regulator n=1 Tax=Gracilimonas aurantiaca TaxID=3234185 RepID=UPI003465A312